MSNIISNAAVPESLADILVDLGSVPADRVRLVPRPSTATLQDVTLEIDKGLRCELIDGTLVDKVMGWQESLIAAYLIEILGGFVRRSNLGLVTGPDGFVRLLGSLVRGPDVAFTSWDRLPDHSVPQASIPEVVPDLAVEIISLSNTRAEMSRKRREYFHAGVRLVWMVDPRARSVAVYTSISEYKILDDAMNLEGGNVLPGLEIELGKLFAELDRRPNMNSDTS